MKPNPFVLYLFFLCLLFFPSCFPQKKQADKNIVEEPAEEEINRIPDEPFSDETGPESGLQRVSEGHGIHATTSTARQERTLTLQEVQKNKEKSNFSLGSQQHQVLLPVLGHSVLLPRDYIIGPLPDSLSSSREQKAILNTLNEFFDSFRNGKIETSLLAGNTQSDLALYLTHYIDQGIIPEEVRYGIVTIDNDDNAHLNARIFGKNGSSEGSIYLVKDNKWYISDIQIDFYDIETKGDSNAKPFRPTTYNSIDGY